MDYQYTKRFFTGTYLKIMMKDFVFNNFLYKFSISVRDYKFVYAFSLCPNRFFFYLVRL